MMYEKNHGHSQLRIWRVRFWGMSFGDIWWRSTSKTQIRWLILATFIPLAPNVASMELPWDAQRNRQKGQIHATSTLHQKTVSKWRVYTVDRWMIHVKHQCILLIYPILYISFYIYIYGHPPSQGLPAGGGVSHMYLHLYLSNCGTCKNHCKYQCFLNTLYVK